MSRKSQRNRTQQDPPSQPQAAAESNRALYVGAVAALLLALLAGAALFKSKTTPDAPATDSARPAALASEHSPALGDAAARVHIVEFLDPACETCAQFYPVIKQLMAENPGKLRVSLRHVAFHEGAEYAIRVLEASRNQDKYWQTLEALFASQAQWAPHHTVQPELVDQVIAGVGLDLQRLAADMNSPEVTTRIERDRADAMALKVTATPEYFVNGRPLPSFGYDQLLGLVNEELQAAY
jgi:protein-disulfide isomerase